MYRINKIILNIPFILSKTIPGLMQVVHFHERNSGGVVYPAHDRGVITWGQVCDDRRFSRVPRGVAAVLNGLDLVAGDDAADDRLLPIIIGGN